MSDPQQAAGAEARFVVVAEMPMLALGLADGPADDALATRLAIAGLAQLPGFYGVELPRGAKVGLTVQAQHLRLEGIDGEGLLQLPRDAVEPGWLAAAKRLRGTMLVVGRALALDPDASDQSVCDELHTAALDGRLRGAIVGVAEPKATLPLLW